MKPRFESLELKIMRALRSRMTLAVKDENYYNNLEKGYKGEQNFDKLTETLRNNNLVINDLLLEYNNTVFQIDSALFSANTIYLFEVKNYEGDFYVESGRWYSQSKTEIKNPLLQLERTESLFRRLIKDLGFTFSIEAYLIFINPEFQLYQAPLNQPIVFPAQLNRFIDKVKKHPSNIKETHTKLANKLISIQLSETPHNHLPEYAYNNLDKGIFCPNCQALYTTFIKTTLICNSCGGREEHHIAVLRNVEEFKLLFPNKNITTNQIYDWCNIIKTKKTIRKILSRFFKLIGHGNSSCYIDKD